MTVAFSTSSPLSSVALIGSDGVVLAADSESARMRASGACLAILDRLLKNTGRSLLEASLFAADLGPGSFTGVRVGVTLAKTFAYSLGAPCVGATAFDLIDPLGTVILPSRKGEFFVRPPGSVPYRSTELPGEPFRGFPCADPTYPLAVRFAALLQVLPRVDPMHLNPEYLIEPSISQPKKPFGGSPA